MTNTGHRIFIVILAVIVIACFTFILLIGISYYKTGLEERVYSQEHELLKPSGSLGHGYGIVGSVLMITGIASYMSRKRFRFLSRAGLLKHWLEFHIFLCTLGPLMILFHTAFKFGGIVAVSFWCMVAVFLSGIVGRFIYLQIPHSIEGQVLTLNEVRGMKTDIAGIIKGSHYLDEESYNLILNSVKKKAGIYYSNPFLRFIFRIRDDRNSIRAVRKVLKMNNLPPEESRKIIALVKDDVRLNRRIDQLDTMQNMFKYWHVIHLPFAMVMLIIMVIHISVTILFGYRWIF